jgi:PhzF family phenazine biosynthesis protein
VGVPLLHVDAFTAVPFAGNAAAVCVLAAAADERWMQRVASELNLGATAFVTPDATAGFRLRWFSPTVELALCGHGTLATAHVLWERKAAAKEATLEFQTKSGPLRARRRGAWIELDFPLEPEAPAEPPPDLVRALGVTPKYVGRNRLDYLVEVDDEATLRRTRPDFARLRVVPTRGVIVTSAAADPDYDFVSRFFAPAVGIDEDAVTGSAHCCLAGFWRARLGRDGLRGYQASARGGVVQTEVDGDRVRLGGQAVTVLRGELATPPASAV